MLRLPQGLVYRLLLPSGGGGGGRCASVAAAVELLLVRQVLILRHRRKKNMLATTNKLPIKRICFIGIFSPLVQKKEFVKRNWRKSNKQK
ncbi:MAG: hypothetical protein U0175_20700 [Caldilineaceae bacterium]